MDSSAPKRRKTSPTTNVPVDDANIPPTSNELGRPPAQRHRPSFASPTKASLARSNPDILERRSASRAPEVRPAGDGTEQTSGEAQDAQSTPADQPWSPVRRATGAMASKPRRTPNKQSAQPMLQPSAGNLELMNPFKGRALRRSPPPGEPVSEEPEVQEAEGREIHEEPQGPEAEGEAEEPEEPIQPEEQEEQEQELPPTPTQKGISDPASVNTSPMGIHNTPTKRPRRSRALAERIKSSPLKQPPLFPKGPTKESLREESPSRAVVKLRTLREQPQRNKKRKSHSARNVEEPDPLADKKTLRDSLLAEIAHLKSDLELATRENNRLHQLQQTRRGSSRLGGPEDKDGLLGLLRRHILPPEKEAAPDPTQDWLEAALNPISFLPFSKADSSLPILFASQPERTEKEETEKPPASHHPIAMTADEELPYLQVFTPLTFTSTVSIIPRDESIYPGPLSQKHVVSVSSTPPGLFAAKVEMTVNTKSLSITELSVPRIEPSAVSELGPFVEKVVHSPGTSALTRNVSIITWAMSEWLRVATRRAQFWCAVERDLGSSEGLMKCATEMRKDTRKRGLGRRAAADGSDDEEDEQELGTKKARLTKTDLLPQLGRTNLDLELSDPTGTEEVPSIRIQWRIEFDWTGEAQSKMELLLRVPAKWRGHDTRGSLTSIPGMFDKLIRENNDPMEALRTVVALLVGEG
ncbi:uncharacterized protein GGS22DRAFT_156060 [Annulohypoxylon maeteangense]|uniref:uncharacterized protein n=1 Tax=Annulohypoxylon maeteangense TaxID=1927788 RepID=UPI002007A81F|nr:uncharacterized protein GGS22DRAFT_156060 [Annulohypoxylon maeteangense]KAI0888511.1 hypothetical protein GGS22DRAFT_156060 [Annulohypoxylon maeteangense]